jgi:hypothetical protein
VRDPDHPVNPEPRRADALSGENRIERYIDVQTEPWQEDPQLVVAQPRALAL